MKDKINILAISAGNTGGVAFHRIMIPMGYLNEHSDDFNVLYCADEEIDIQASNLDNISIVHFHANITYNKPLMDKLMSMKKRGCKLVMDMDDYPIIPEHNPAHKAYNEKLRDNIIYWLTRVDVITTTTKLFKNELKKVTKVPIEVFPNVIDSQYEQFSNRPVQSDRLRIGLIGGASHFKDVELLEGMAKQLKPYINQIQFVIAGFDVYGNDNDKILNPWNDVERMLTDNYSTISEDYKDYLFRYDKEDYPDVNNQPYKRIWTLPITEYAKVYNQIDILIAPLVNDRFNKMKSELKIVEAGNFGKVFIGSAVGQYKEVITNGVDGILIGSKNDWADAIIEILENPPVYNYLRENLYNLCQNKYSIDKLNDKRIELYKKITRK